MTSLCPEDVPGAVLPDQVSLETHPVLKLQRWLECRGLKKVETKVELITRIENCIKAGNDEKIYSGVDGGKWCDMKNNVRAGTSSTTELILDEIAWGQFPSCDIPQYFDKGNVYTYIVGENIENDDPEIVEISEDQSVTTVKPFRRGLQYVNSEHISNVEDSEKNNVYICKYKCLSSFQKTIQCNEAL